MKNKDKCSLKLKIIYLSLFPIMCVSLALCIFSFYFINTIILNNCKEELNHLSNLCIDNLIMYDTSQYQQCIEIFSEETDTEISIIQNGKRVCSTIDNGIGTYPNDRTMKALSHSDVYSYPNTSIGDIRYFTFYKASETSVIEIAKPISKVNEMLWKTVYPIFSISAIIIIFSLIVIYNFTSNLTESIEIIDTFVQKITEENFDARIDEKIYKRDDEIGEIGKGISLMRNTIKDLIEIDGLTKLYNRKTGDKKLNAVIEKCKYNNSMYSMAIGDIDFFKKVNDTYGHEAGDEVLKKIAYILKKNISKYGFVSRWGGEEFMIVFINKTREEAVALLDDILKEIRDTVIIHNGKEIKVTMSFGVVKGNLGKTTEELFGLADKRLYYAKEHGRNQVVGKVKC